MCKSTSIDFVLNCIVPIQEKKNADEPHFAGSIQGNTHDGTLNVRQNYLVCADCTSISECHDGMLNVRKII